MVLALAEQQEITSKTRVETFTKIYTLAETISLKAEALLKDITNKAMLAQTNRANMQATAMKTLEQTSAANQLFQDMETGLTTASQTFI